MSAAMPLSRRRDRLRTRLQRMLRFRGALVVVLWQVPLGPGVGPDGRVSLLFGGGLDELATFNCSGEVVTSEPVGYVIAALEADYDIAPNWRIEAAGGRSRLAVDNFTWNESSFGLLLRRDWEGVGLGAGIVRAPGGAEFGNKSLPSVHLRVGPAERVHMRADVAPPSALVGKQLLRAGVGYNATRRDAASGHLTVAALGRTWWAGDDGGVGIAGELALPVNEQFGMRLSGHLGKGHEQVITGLVIGGSYMLR